MPNIGILGAGRHAAEVMSYCDTKVDFQAVQKAYAGEGVIDMGAATQEQLDTPVVAAIGAPGLRRSLVEMWAGKEYATIVAQNAHVDSTAHIGEGSQIAPLSAVMTNVILGRHCIVNVQASISHDCNLGDYTTISPGVHVGGRVVTGKGVFVGIGATIRDSVRLADGVVIGAGAVLIHDAAEVNGVYVGNPARLIKSNQDWLNDI